MSIALFKARKTLNSCLKVPHWVIPYDLLNYPFESTRIYALDFLGSCNGLICSRIHSSYRAYLKSECVETKLCILNPLTREFKEVIQPGYIYNVKICGFGYDSNLNDYKVVIVSDYERTSCSKIHIYKVKLGSWSSSIQGTVNYSFKSGKRSYGKFFNGALHWLGRITNKEASSKVIVCFDISNETILNMPLPENIMSPLSYFGETDISVGVLGDCICVAFIWDPVRIDVWVMQEYGVKESWSFIKQISTQLPRSSYVIPFWKPLWCYDNGEILVDNYCCQLLLYDPANERCRSVVGCSIIMHYNPESYVETIVSLNSGTYLDKRIINGIVKNSERLLSR